MKLKIDLQSEIVNEAADIHACGFFFSFILKGFYIYIGVFDIRRLVKLLQDMSQSIAWLSLASWIPWIVTLFEVALFELGKRY